MTTLPRRRLCGYRCWQRPASWTWRIGRCPRPGRARSWWPCAASGCAARTCTTTSTAGSVTSWSRSPLVLGHEASGRDRRRRRRRRPRPRRAPGSRSSPARRAGAAPSARPAATTCARTCGSSPRRPSTARSPSTSRSAPTWPSTCPTQVSDDAAALLEPLSVGIWATGKAALTAGSSVLIAGAGPIGLVAAQVARARGATTIAVTDIAPHRLAAARAQRGHADPGRPATPPRRARSSTRSWTARGPRRRSPPASGAAPGRAGRAGRHGPDEMTAAARAAAAARADRHRDVPLRQYLAHGHRAGRQRRGRPGRGWSPAGSGWPRRRRPWSTGPSRAPSSRSSSPGAEPRPGRAERAGRSRCRSRCRFGRSASHLGPPGGLVGRVRACHASCRRGPADELTLTRGTRIGHAGGRHSLSPADPGPRSATPWTRP